MRRNTTTPIDLTGSVVRAHLRRSGLSPDLVAAFVVTILSAAFGQFEFGLTDEVTKLIPAGETIKDKASQYTWDMEMEDAAGRVTPIMYGDVKVFREVTHD
jgi:hypothetical protein